MWIVIEQFYHETFAQTNDIDSLDFFHQPVAFPQ